MPLVSQGMTENKSYTVNFKDFDSETKRFTDTVRKTGTITGSEAFMSGFTYAGPHGDDAENGVDYFNPDGEYMSMCDFEPQDTEEVDPDIPAGATVAEREAKTLAYCEECMEEEQGYCLFYSVNGSLWAMKFTDFDAVRGLIYGFEWFGHNQNGDGIKYLFFNGERVNLDEHIKSN